MAALDQILSRADISPFCPAAGVSKPLWHFIRLAAQNSQVRCKPRRIGPTTCDARTISLRIHPLPCQQEIAQVTSRSE